MNLSGNNQEPRPRMILSNQLINIPVGVL